MWTPPERIKHRLPEVSWPSAVEAESALLFQPIRYQAFASESRCWVPAMVPWRSSENGEVTDAVCRWYARFAAGRPGVIVVEATGVRDVPSGPLLRANSDAQLEGLKRLVDAVREASGGKTRLLIQLIDFLRLRRRPSPERYFRDYLRVTSTHRQALAAVDGGALQWLECEERALREKLLEGGEPLWAQVLNPRELEALGRGARQRVDDLDDPEISSLPDRLPEAFAAAAARVKSAGFDGIELHYAHAYTMASFLSQTNQRSDGYGGDLAGRLRLPLEVYHAVRARVGADFPVGARVLVNEVIEGGNRLTESLPISAALAAAGLDFLSLSKGGKFEDAKQPKVGAALYPYTGQSGYECMPTIYSDARGPFGRNLEEMAKLRAGLRAAGHQLPVIVAGGIQSFTQAEEALQRGAADLIGAARQSLADPDWWEKMRLGRGAEIRRCAMTNYCEALDTQHKQVTCRLWDRQGLAEEGVARSHDGRRRLEAPEWDTNREVGR